MFNEEETETPDLKKRMDWNGTVIAEFKKLCGNDLVLDLEELITVTHGKDLDDAWRIYLTAKDTAQYIFNQYTK